MKENINEVAAKFVNRCKSEGWSIQANANVVRIHKRFTAGDKDAYVDCDCTAYGLLAMLPMKGGSVWGTDGGSIGGMVGLNGGYYTLNKSGSNGKRLSAAINKLL